MCDHDFLDFEIEPRAFNDTNVRELRMSVRCRLCKQKFRFLGCAVGPNTDRPYVSVDDTVVALPMIEQYEEIAHTMEMH